MRTIKDLLRQFVDQHPTVHFHPSAQSFAEAIFRVTGGHTGIAGVCLDQLAQKAIAKANRDEAMTITEWHKFAAMQLPSILKEMQTYESIMDS